MNILRVLIAGSVIAGSLVTLSSTGIAEDPVVVHYSDPSLARMEAQIGVTPGQKERFEDIVVKYRDSFNDQAAENPGQGKIRSGGTGRHGGTRASSQDQSGPDQTGVPFRGRKNGASRKELDELATILAPDQLKKFQELNNRTKGKRHATSAG